MVHQQNKIDKSRRSFPIIRSDGEKVCAAKQKLTVTQALLDVKWMNWKMHPDQFIVLWNLVLKIDLVGAISEDTTILICEKSSGA